MTKEGRLKRGKENYEAGKFLNNSETMAYAETLKAEKPKEKAKEAEEDVKPNK